MLGKLYQCQHQHLYSRHILVSYKEDSDSEVPMCMFPHCVYYSIILKENLSSIIKENERYNSIDLYVL